MRLEGKGLPLRHTLKLDEVIASTVRGQQCTCVLEILVHSLLADDLVSLAIPVGSKDSRKALSGAGTHGCRRSTRTTCTGKAWSRPRSRDRGRRFLSRADAAESTRAAEKLPEQAARVLR